MRNSLVLMLLLMTALSSCHSHRRALRRQEAQCVEGSKHAIHKNSTEEYIAFYKNTAIRQMRKYGIPASIILAQGILESSNGNSDLARYANNHFGIKCTNEWNGKTYYKDDDKPDECFRKYTDADASFRDHSEFLKRSKYASLFNLKSTDYKGWAKGLKKCGYATNPKYPELLINLIERYKLQQYD
ncbi:MAG: Mannosyl-glycoprotein endo-beta-N-acetylglucosamidase [Flavipsychrobacter sp.]|nr:Mannosyl-glycoprotein endo-beta-N-acetylglucosamidase [Flavipsychrobacter sp.]